VKRLRPQLHLGVITSSEPRVGVVLLGDTLPVFDSNQTHEVYSSFTDVQSYKLNDELIYTSLYTPLHENLKSMMLCFLQTLTFRF
jgi:hypothetical protein